MKTWRAWFAAIVLGASAVATVEGGVAARDGGGTSGSNTTITVRGVFEALAVDTASGGDTRYAVHGTDGSWWLDGLAEPVPPSGSTIAVTGTPSGDHTLRVATARVTAPPTGSAAMTTAAARSTRVLLLRIYWGARPPARPTAKAATRKAIKQPAAWFREVSHGRYTVSGTVTRWLKVPRPGNCVEDAFTIRTQALAAAQRAGVPLARYGRLMYYLPCNTGGLLGFAALPGNEVWLFNTLDLQVLVHEQGHNLGLHHASARTCTSQAWEAVTWSSSCRVNEYGDEIDTMGNRQAGHYNSFFKFQLGWLQAGTTVTSTRTVNLAPHETTGRGIKGIRLRAGNATYWLEYRTRSGRDRAMPAGAAGVQIRLQAADGKTQLLDAGVGSTVNHYDFADVHLPAGSSWTTPNKVRITVTRQTASAATVAIKFRAGAAWPPAAPSRVGVQALAAAARITWTRPADNGAIIREYRITRNDGATRAVTSFAGATTAYTWPGLDPNRTYRFSVRAMNQAGTSAATASPLVRPLTDKPSAAITSPAQGATVSGVVPITITVAPNPSTKSPIEYGELLIDGNLEYYFFAPWEPFLWDTTWFGDGPHTIRLNVVDQAGKVAVVTRNVVVDNP